MKVKRYVANSLPDAMSRIRDDLGDRAVILDSKPIKQGGLWGLFGRQRFEVIAAVDHGVEGPRLKQHRVERDSPQDGLKREIESIKQMMEQWMYTQQNDLPRPFAAVETHLKRQHVTDDVIASLFRNVQPRIRDIQNADEKEIYSLVAGEIRERFEARVGTPLSVGSGPKTIYLIGPTGVGKTTTIAKMAAVYVLEQGLSVGLIAADTFRIAAVKQLKTYADILNVPIHVAHDPNEMKEAKEKLSHCDVVLVDTAGRNYRQKMNVSELFAYIQHSDQAAIHLVLSLTMRDEDIDAVLESVSSIPVTHLLLTKADETTSYGLMLNLVSKTPYKLGLITTGQNVPDDMVEADADQLTQWIMEEVDGNA